VQAVIGELEKLGCQSVADITYVNFDEDLNAVLLPVERRKLKAKLATTGQCSSMRVFLIVWLTFF
jgi:hypothetical protein